MGSTNALVIYASRHGATQGIAERIAAILGQEGVQATVQPAGRAGDMADYEAFVIGSAVYARHWQKEASEFVRRNRAWPVGRCGCSVAARWAPRLPMPRGGL